VSRFVCRVCGRPGEPAFPDAHACVECWEEWEERQGGMTNDECRMTNFTVAVQPFQYPHPGTGSAVGPEGPFRGAWTEKMDGLGACIPAVRANWGRIVRQVKQVSATLKWRVGRWWRLRSLQLRIFGHQLLYLFYLCRKRLVLFVRRCLIRFRLFRSERKLMAKHGRDWRLCTFDDEVVQFLKASDYAAAVLSPPPHAGPANAFAAGTHNHLGVSSAAGSVGTVNSQGDCLLTPCLPRSRSSASGRLRFFNEVKV